MAEGLSLFVITVQSPEQAAGLEAAKAARLLPLPFGISQFLAHDP